MHQFLRYIITTRQMALFVLFNCILPNFDVITDGLTYFDLIERAHYNWAFLNMYFMWNSFVLHVFAFFS